MRIGPFVDISTSNTSVHERNATLTEEISSFGEVDEMEMFMCLC